MTFFPLVGAALVMLLARNRPSAARAIALGTSLLGLLLAAGLYLDFVRSGGAAAFAQNVPWIPGFGLNYSVRMSPFPSVLVLLTGVLVPVAVLASWNVGRASFHALLLALQTALFGVFTAHNLLLWFLWFELGLVPAFFLIKMFGHEHRAHAAYKFFLYTLLGSVPMLVALAYVFSKYGTLDFVPAGYGTASILMAFDSRAGVPVSVTEAWVFWAFFLGVAVKIPLWLLHSWLPDAYTQAPYPVSMLLTGLMSKMGVYGLVLLMSLLPVQFAANAPALVWLAAATVLVSVLAALRRRDIKELAAYSSINHVGLCALGLFAFGLEGMPGLAPATATQQMLGAGVWFQMFSHGLIGAALFLGAGFLQERFGGNRSLDGFGGLRGRMPVFAGLYGVTVFAAVGLPGLSGFVGEFMILKGVLAVSPGTGALALLGLIFTTMIFLRLLHHVFHGPPGPGTESVRDLDAREILALAVPVALMIVLGLFPRLLLGFWAGGAS